VLDTGRRGAEVLAILKETVPRQLRVAEVSTVTDRPTPYVRRRGRAAPPQEDPKTRLVIEGSVAAKEGDREVSIGEAKHIVDNFLKALEEQGAFRVHVREVLDWPAFCAKLHNKRPAGAPAVGARIWELLPPDAQAAVTEGAQGGLLPHESKTRIVEALNEILRRRDFYRGNDYGGVALQAEANELLKRDRQAMSERYVQRLNRLLLEASYPRDIARSLFSTGKVTNYPDPEEMPARHPFRMVVPFADPFRGG
jgi:hypothetical protein